MTVRRKDEATRQGPGGRLRAQRPYLVHIVETTDEFSEGKALAGLFSSLGVPFTFDQPRTLHDFERCLRTDLALARAGLIKKGRITGTENPILHLSSHASVSPRDGTRYPPAAWITLASGERVKWPQIRPAVSDLNDAFGGTLVLCASTCWGIQSDQIAMRTDRQDPPFYATVANSKRVPVRDCEKAFLAFYESLFAGACLEEAVRTMKDASGNVDFVLHYGKDTTEPFHRLMEIIRDGMLGEELRERYRPKWQVMK